MSEERLTCSTLFPNSPPGRLCGWRHAQREFAGAVRPETVSVFAGRRGTLRDVAGIGRERRTPRRHSKIRVVAGEFAIHVDPLGGGSNPVGDALFHKGLLAENCSPPPEGQESRRSLLGSPQLEKLLA
jgi:hypothetical protein